MQFVSFELVDSVFVLDHQFLGQFVKLLELLHSLLFGDIQFVLGLLEGVQQQVARRQVKLVYVLHVKRRLLYLSFELLEVHRNVLEAVKELFLQAI